MKCDNHEKVTALLSRVQDLKDEVEFLQDRKSQLKLELFYDTDNEEIMAELEKIKQRHIELNNQITLINNQILLILKEKEDK